MEERTWREHCNKLGIRIGEAGLVCPTCKTDLEVKYLVQHLIKWGEAVEKNAK